MGYTVARPGGCSDWDLREYVTYLNQHGIKLGRAPRVRDPLTGGRWLAFWDDRAAAEAHAAAMRKRYKDKTWRVVEVRGPGDVGPIWPLVCQVTQGWGQIDITLDSLTELVLATAHPEAAPAASCIMIQTKDWDRYVKAGGGFGRWARDVMPALTGLSLAQIEAIGFTLVDYYKDEVVASTAGALPTSLAGVS